MAVSARPPARPRRGGRSRVPSPSLPDGDAPSDDHGRSSSSSGSPSSSAGQWPPRRMSTAVAPPLAARTTRASPPAAAPAARGASPVSSSSSAATMAPDSVSSWRNKARGTAGAEAAAVSRAASGLGGGARAGGGGAGGSGGRTGARSTPQVAASRGSASRERPGRGWVRLWGGRRVGRRSRMWSASRSVVGEGSLSRAPLPLTHTHVSGRNIDGHTTPPHVPGATRTPAHAVASANDGCMWSPPHTQPPGLQFSIQAERATAVSLVVSVCGTQRRVFTSAGKGVRQRTRKKQEKAKKRTRSENVVRFLQRACAPGRRGWCKNVKKASVVSLLPRCTQGSRSV